MIYDIYNKNPDTNIIIYNMTAGTLSLGRPFGSKSDSGHYITIMINVREFVENDTIYIIDSIGKNLKGENNHNVNYNFVEKPNYGKFKSFNDAFEISRVSEQVIKLSKKDGIIDADSLSLLGLEGGCGIIICPNNLVKKINNKKVK